MGDRARLTGVMPGEIVPVTNEHERNDPTMVLGRCGRSLGYFCVTHQTRLANAHQLEAHIDTSTDRAHWLTAWCQTHGLEALPTSNAEALAAALGAR